MERPESEPKNELLKSFLRNVLAESKESREKGKVGIITSGTLKGEPAEWYWVGYLAEVTDSEAILSDGRVIPPDFIEEVDLLGEELGSPTAD